MTLPICCGIEWEIRKKMKKLVILSEGLQPVVEGSWQFVAVNDTGAEGAVGCVQI